MIIGVVKRVAAVFLVAMAVAVAVNLMLTPVYHDGSPEDPVWRILNWFMAVCSLLGAGGKLSAKAGRGKRGRRHPPAPAGRHGLLRGHRADHVVLLGVALDFELRQRDRRCRNLASHLLPRRGLPLRSRGPNHRPLSLERRGRPIAKGPAWRRSGGPCALPRAKAIGTLGKRCSSSGTVIPTSGALHENRGVFQPFLVSDVEVIRQPVDGLIQAGSQRLVCHG